MINSQKDGDYFEKTNGLGPVFYVAGRTISFPQYL